MGGIGVYSKLSIYNRPAHSYLYSNLCFLRIYVANFDDCLCLLDGGLDRLTSFSVTIEFVSEKRSVVYNRVSDL
jgi:hypothetical protein